jgi:cytochrome c peroxidase
MQRLAWAATALAVLAAACGEPASEVSVDNPNNPPGNAQESPTPWPITAFPALPEDVANVPAARLELGHMLFFDPVLSVDQETACATCHSEQWGMGDALARSVGHGAGLLSGPGRRGPNVLRRNAPSLYNLAFRETLLWDGRSRSLEEQALFPLLADDEMSLDPNEAIAKLAAIPEYVELFATAFPDDPVVNLANLASALAAYQRTFITNESIYDGYVEGLTELMNEEQVEGMFRFAEMGCDGCHAPPLFESEVFANRNVPNPDGIVDDGLAEHTGLSEDRGKFRTMTLRNIISTEPYFHNGSVARLDEAVRHELEQSGLPFDDEDVRLITLFIRETLRDESREAKRPFEVPSRLEIPIDPPGSR